MTTLFILSTIVLALSLTMMRHSSLQLSKVNLGTRAETMVNIKMMVSITFFFLSAIVFTTIIAM